MRPVDRDGCGTTSSTFTLTEVALNEGAGWTHKSMPD
jgi:hypothetical protein